MSVNYHIVFHDDVDGIICAALFLHNQLYDGDQYRLYPVMSAERGKKFREMVSKMSLKSNDKLIVLDYEYHEKADLWVDHHFEPRMGDAPVKNKKIRYDPDAKSAARLVHEIDSPRKSQYSESMLAMVDMIDNCGYKSVNQIFTDNHPIMILRSYLERSFPSEMMHSRIVEVLANTRLNLKVANYRLKLSSHCIKQMRGDVERAKKEMLVSGNMSVIHQRRQNQFPRYAEYFLAPDIKYAVRMSNFSGGRLYLQVGYNKWHKEPNDINIGVELGKLDYPLRGGGHYNVGGGLLKISDKERLLNDLDIIFNKREEGEAQTMEKLGVDKENDPVESKAQEMVKSGSVDNIDKARKEVAKDDAEKEGK